MGLEVYIGPNGFGKTTKLNSIRDELISTGVNEINILFLDSEILLLDEMKDTKDDSKTMEFILSELFNTDIINDAKLAFESAIDSEVTIQTDLVNTIIEEILLLNGNDRGVLSGRGAATTVNKNFIEKTTKKEYKKLVKINSKELVENKMGSGQRMQLILSLIKESSKTHIIIDEPEKYSHPSLLHRTAKLIQDISTTKNIYISTHSSKLLSMLDIDFSKLFIINDNTHTPKVIDFDSICNLYSTHATTISTVPSCAKSFSYFTPNELIKNIKNLHYHNFMDAIFSKRIYLVEGVNDSLFINKMLQDNALYYSDYAIFHSFGKHHMMLFASIFEFLGIEVYIYFDEDNSTIPFHVSTNTILNCFSHKHMFVPKLEIAIGFGGSKQNTNDFVNHLYAMVIPNTYLV